MKRKSAARPKRAVTKARAAAASARMPGAGQPAADEQPGKVVELQEPFVADQEERPAEDSPETDVAPDRLEQVAPKRRAISPDVCSLAEDASVPGSDLD